MMVNRFLQRLSAREKLDPELQQVLSAAGYYGRTAKCVRCTLIGVLRPGWVQLFELHLRAKRQEGDWEDKFAICHTDERDGTYEIQLFDDEQACREARLAASEGMLVAGGGQSHPVKTMLMVLFAVALVLAISAAALTMFGVLKPRAGDF